MLATDIREYELDIITIQRRRDVLESLLGMRSKQLQESLTERIKRAHTRGDWSQLSPVECAVLYKQEKLYHKSQFDTLQHELTRTISTLVILRQAKKRARQIREDEVAYERKKRQVRSLL